MRRAVFLTMLSVFAIGVLIFSSGLLYAQGGRFGHDGGNRQNSQRVNNSIRINTVKSFSQPMEAAQREITQKRSQKRETGQKRAAERDGGSQE